MLINMVKYGVSVKILIVCRVLWPGGVQRMVFKQAEGLFLLGNDVDLFFLRDTNRYTYPTSMKYEVFIKQARSSKVVDYILKKITNKYNPQRGDDAVVDIDYIWRFQKSIKTNYDIIYYTDEFAALFNSSLKRRNGAMIVTMIHEPVDKNGPLLWRLIEKKVIKNSDLVLTHSQEAKRLLNVLYNNKIEEVFLGTDVITNIPEFNKRENFAISVTMWDYGRFPEKLIDIGSKITNGKIILVGSWTDNKYLESVKEDIKKRGLEKTVIITGQVTEEELLNFYKVAKCSIRFGYNERGPGMGALESISWGIPVIFNDGIGIKEVAENQKNGFLVNLNDTGFIAKIITSLFENQKLWETISKNNSELAVSLSWMEHNKKLNNLFQELISE